MLPELVCPRDHEPLVRAGDTLTCPAGHAYPIHGGIPVFVLPEVPQTDSGCLRALDPEWIARELAHDDGSTPLPVQVHPIVREILGGSCGNMYDAVKHELDHYPIPHLRLPSSTTRQTLLDIGCNWGRWAIAATQAGYRVTGIDPSFGALVIARRVFRQFGLTGNFICADARYLPFKSNSFEVAFSYSVFQHFNETDVRLSLAELARVTRGSSLVQMAGKFGLRSIYQQLRRLGSQPTAFNVRYWSPRELLSVFNDIIGPSRISIDGFFGLGMQASDLEYFRPIHQMVLQASETLRRYQALAPLADSLYIHSEVSADVRP